MFTIQAALSQIRSIAIWKRRTYSFHLYRRTAHLWNCLFKVKQIHQHTGMLAKFIIAPDLNTTHAFPPKTCIYVLSFLFFKMQFWWQLFKRSVFSSVGSSGSSLSEGWSRPPQAAAAAPTAPTTSRTPLSLLLEKVCIRTLDCEHC